MAREFAAAGDRVAVHYGSSRGAADEVAASLAGDGHVVVGADLGDPEAVRAMVAAAAEGLGGLDVLVNNAGVFTPHPITETTYEEWQRAWHDTLAVNLLGAANATWCAVPHMIEAGGGRIVNVSSRGAFRGEPRSPAYGASKAASSPSASRWPAPSARTASPSPPSPRAGRRPTWPPTRWPARAATRSAPRARWAASRSREDVARAVLYLASPEAEMASGTVLDVNGASFLRM